MFALWKRYRHVAAVAPLMLGLIATASAEAPYPNRNITLVLPFAAGSGTDTTTRIISKELGTALGVGMLGEKHFKQMKKTADFFIWRKCFSVSMFFSRYGLAECDVFVVTNSV